MPSDAAPFADLPQDEQVAVLAASVRDVLPRFGLRGEPTLVLRGYNATFRVDDPTLGPVAVRCNLDSPHGVSDAAGELAWVTALAEDGVDVPAPVPPLDGVVPTTSVPGLRDDAPVVAYRWVEAPDLGDLLDEPDHRDAALAGLRALGATMARLHEHAEGFTLPAGATRPTFSDWQLGEDDRLASTDGPWRTDAVDETLAAARARIATLVDRALADTTRHVLAHVDLHGGNAKWDGQRLSVFDFDDCGFTAPAMDVAVSVFYLRDDPATEEAFLAGLAGAGTTGAALAALAASPVHEALLASRQLLMLQAVACSPSGGDGTVDPVEYAERTRRRLAHWLEHGRFLLVPPS